MITTRKALWAVPLIASLISIMLLPQRQEDGLAFAAAKRLHSELTSCRIHILDGHDLASGPTSQCYVCRPTDEFNLDEAVRSLVDMVLSGRIRTIAFHDHRSLVRVTEGRYQGVIVSAHDFIDPNTGRHCTVLQIWIS